MSVLSSFVEGNFFNNNNAVQNPTGPILAISVPPGAANRKVYVWVNNNGATFLGTMRFSLRGVEVLTLPIGNVTRTAGASSGSIGIDWQTYPHLSSIQQTVNPDTLWLANPDTPTPFPLPPTYIKIDCDTVAITFESITNGGFLQSVYLGVYSEPML